VKRVLLLLAMVPTLVGSFAHADGLPQGYLVWTRGQAQDGSTRKIFRMTMPDMSDVQPLTAGEDVEPRISPSGQWVAYAKAKFPGGSDYHDFTLWRPYIVSIHGAGNGRQEIKIDDDGAWPSWSASGALFYNQASGTQSRIVKVVLDDHGHVTSKQVWLETQTLFPGYSELNECFIAPDETWFAGRTRGNTIQNGVSGFALSPPQSVLLARAGSIGCMPFVAPGGLFGIIAGAGQGIRWGHSPLVPNRVEDQQLIAPLTANHLAYHPGISTDEKWVLAAQGTDTDHNAGRYDLYIHTLDTTTMTAGVGQVLTSDGFNGWPHLWVGAPSPPPPAQPTVDDFYPSSYTAAPGESVTLMWTTFGADVVTLDGTVVDANGSLVVQPTTTTTYSLAAASSVVSTNATRTVTVVVNAVPQPAVITRFDATPPKISKGTSTVLTWDVANATTLTLEGVRVAPAGSHEVSPLQTTSYVLTVQGQTGPASATVTVVVTAPASTLLPDRGGFVCALRGRASRAEGIVLVAALALVLVVRRSRRARRASRNALRP
jgi:hypothetical protein